MLVKIHTSYRNVVAICDSNLVGKIFEDGNKQIFVNPNFFQGEEKTKEQIEEIIEEGMAEDFTFNIVGEESVGIALKKGAIKEEGVIKIQNIPIALVLL